MKQFKFFSTILIVLTAFVMASCEDNTSYKLTIKNPTDNLVLNEEIELLITSEPEGLPFDKVKGSFSQDGIIALERLDNGFKLTAKQVGTTTLTVSYGKVSYPIDFKVHPNYTITATAQKYELSSGEKTTITFKCEPEGLDLTKYIPKPELSEDSRIKLTLLTDGYGYAVEALPVEFETKSKLTLSAKDKFVDYNQTIVFTILPATTE